MSATMFEPLLRDATIKAIDGVAKKLTKAESIAENKMTRLLAHWNDMEDADKEHVVGIAIATITTAVTAIIALRRRAKSPLKTAGKSVVKAIARKVR
jgi:hypothetical protein